MYDPPDPGIEAPSSLQIMPSEMVMTNAISQPSIACGPPNVDSSSGIVMKGPMPIMLVMFSAVASNKPKRRSSCGASGTLCLFESALICYRKSTGSHNCRGGHGGPPL